MKLRLLIISFIICHVSTAQTITEKYDSLMKRYEYYNTAGEIIGYKSYDSLNKTWVYSEVTTNQQKQNANTYVEPVNIELVQQALEKKQTRYDNNVEQIQSTIDELGSKIENLDLDENGKLIVSNALTTAIETINSKKYNLSSSSTVQQIKNYLNTSVSNAIVSVKAKINKANILSASSTPKTQIYSSSDKLSNSFLKSFFGNYTAKRFYNSKPELNSAGFTFEKMFEGEVKIVFREDTIEINSNEQSYKSSWVYEDSDQSSYFLKDFYGNKLEIYIVDNKINNISLFTNIQDGKYRKKMTFPFPKKN